MKKIFDFLCGRHLMLYVGGSSKSATTTNIDQSSQVTNIDNKVGASEGSIAIGANTKVNLGGFENIGGNVTIQRVDDAILNAAGEAIVKSSEVARDALDFGAGAQDKANDLVRNTNEMFGAFIGRKLDDSQSTQNESLMKYGFIAVAIGASLFVFKSFKK